MNGTPPPSESKIIAQLTAYLDGELDETEVRSVETQISTDLRYQQLLHQLQQTWDVLDVLPSAEIAAARDFTQSTMKLVVQDAQLTKRKNGENFWTWPFRFLVVCLIPCFAASGTYWTSRYLQQVSGQELESNLSLIRDLDAYGYDKNLSIDFLEKLSARKGLFGVESKSLPASESEGQLSDEELMNGFDLLSELQKQRLRTNLSRFQNLTKPEALRIKSLHSKLSAHPSSNSLKVSLRRYFRWLQTIWETETAQILDETDSDQKIRLIEEITQAKYDVGFGTGDMGFPEKDKLQIYLGLLNIISNPRKQLQMEAEIRNSIPHTKLDDIEFDSQMLFEKDSEDQLIFKNGQWLKLIYQNAPEKINLLIEKQDIEGLKGILTTEARETIENTINWPGNFDKSEAQLLVHWMIEVFDSRFSRPAAPTTVQEVYELLAASERDRIDNQHPVDRRNLLKQKLREMNMY